MFKEIIIFMVRDTFVLLHLNHVSYLPLFEVKEGRWVSQTVANSSGTEIS